MIAAALALALAVPVTAQTPRIEYGQSTQPIVLQLEGVPMGSLITMLMRDVMRVPYVIAPDVLADRRLLTLKLVIPRNKVPEGVIGFLRKSGFVPQLYGGTVYITRAGGSVSAQPYQPALVGGGGNVPYGSPLSPGAMSPVAPGAFVPPVERAAGSDPFPVPNASRSEYAGASAVEVTMAYVPAHRDTAYLAQAVGLIVPGIRFGAKGDVKAQPAQQIIEDRNGPDVLLFAGPAEAVGKVRKVIEILDRPRPLVSVKAVIMTVSSASSRGSALSLLAKVAGGNISAGSFAADPPASQFLRLTTGALSAVLSVVHSDNRFRVVATPNLSALSGGVASINSGAQVPVISSVAVTDSGTPVQSVEYRDSGVTLTVRPVVRGELIEIDVKEERSTFVRTTTGVQDTPTLQKSSASASVVLRSGESVVLAGLAETLDGNTKEGLLGGLLGVRSRDKSEQEMLVVLSAEVVPSPVVVAGQFTVIEADKPGAGAMEPLPDEDGPLPAKTAARVS